MSPRTFLFVGVGGQGALSAAGFLGAAVFKQGLPVTVTQLHGMSQRGGSVQAAVTVGIEEVLSPASLPVGVLVGLELIEAARARARLDQGSVALCNAQVLAPPSLALHRAPVPDADALAASVRGRAKELRLLDAAALAALAGDGRSLNAVMLGALSCLPQCPVSGEALLAALLEETPTRAHVVNQRAFALGRQAFARAPAT